MTDSVSAPRSTRGRSPGYPAIGLEEALRRALQLYDREKRHLAPVSTILDHWGYKPGSGGGMVVVAALKKYGLLEDEGSGSSRKARLTDFAIRILLDDREDSSHRRALLREAALKPTIHAHLWEEYGGSLPSDSTIRYKLLTERLFTDSAVRDFLPQFRATLAFARLDEPQDGNADNLSVHDGDKDRRQAPLSAGEVSSFLSTGISTPSTLAAAAVSTSRAAQETEASSERVFYLPLGRRVAALQVPFPMTRQEWAQLMTILGAMEGGIATAEESE
jgi:hypothetical protein